MNDSQKKDGKEKVLEQNEIKIIIPQCCLEGWESCPHVVKKPDRVKRNVGL